jgi:hypothetical protein
MTSNNYCFICRCKYDKVPKYKQVCETAHRYKTVCSDVTSVPRKPKACVKGTTSSRAGKGKKGDKNDKGGKHGEGAKNSTGSKKPMSTTVRHSWYDYISKKYCYQQKFEYKHNCHKRITFEHVKNCEAKDYDCSYYAYKHVPKVCYKTYCGEYKYDSIKGYDSY